MRDLRWPRKTAPPSDRRRGTADRPATAAVRSPDIQRAAGRRGHEQTCQAIRGLDPDKVEQTVPFIQLMVRLRDLPARLGRRPHRATPNRTGRGFPPRCPTLVPVIGALGSWPSGAPPAELHMRLEGCDQHAGPGGLRIDVREHARDRPEHRGRPADQLRGHPGAGGRGHRRPGRRGGSSRGRRPDPHARATERRDPADGRTGRRQGRQRAAAGPGRRRPGPAGVAERPRPPGRPGRGFRHPDQGRPR